VCGIVGAVSHDPGESRADAVMRATLRQRHRGPDGYGVRESADGHAVLGMNLLSVVSADAECGPYVDEVTGVLLAFNGEVYNHRELAERWSVPCGPRTTDAHVVLHGYLTHGTSVFRCLAGMFAIALYDPRKRRLVLARDRFGEKPLYYRQERGRCHFASEIKALAALVPVTPRVPDSFWALETATGSSTLFDGVELLEPGTCLIVDLATRIGRAERFWSPFPNGTGGVPAWSDTVDVREALRVAVDRTRPQLPFALMLSGGLDSAVLAATMRPDVLITVGYPGDRNLDETQGARLVSESAGIPLVVISPTPADFRSRAADIVHALDHPVGNASLLSEFMLYEKVAELGIRVVVGGTGPDELLLGYVRHAILLDGPRGGGAASLAAYAPLREKFQRFAMPRGSAAERYYRLILRGTDPDGSVRRLVHETFAAAPDVARALSATDLLTAFPPMVLTSDKLSSYFGLERRSPYLDHLFAERCLALPLTQKRTRELGLKAALRQVAAESGVPRAIRDAVDKRGFASPVPSWLDNELRSWGDTWISYLEAAQPRALHGISHGSGRFDRTRMMAVLLGIWYQHWASESGVSRVEGDVVGV